MGFTSVAITVTNVYAIILGTSCTIDPYHNTTRNGGGGATDILTAPVAITSNTTVSNNTSFNDATIPANSFIMFRTTAVTACTQITMSVKYTID